MPERKAMSDAELYQTIGGLKSSVEHLVTTVRDMSNQWATQERAATEGRRVLHEKVDNLKEVATTLVGRVSIIETTMAGIKPAVEEFEDQREQQKGAMKLGKLIWTGVLAASGSTGVAIGYGIKALMGLPAPPHP